MNKLIPLVLATSVTGLIGCGAGGGGGSSAGGGGGGAVSGLEMPVALSVVTASEGIGAARVMGLKAGYKAVIAALTSPDSDYMSDPVHTHVFDRSIESLSTVNMILCLMDQTRASDMVNTGAYIALVNSAKCETGKNQSSSGQSGQSSSQTVEYEKWTINATRVDDSSPMIVKIWVPKSENGGGGSQGGPPNPMDNQEILVETIVTSGVTDANPFGSFTLNFKGVVDGTEVGGTAGTEVPLMKGALFTVSNNSGKPEFKFIETAGAALGGDLATIGQSRTQSSHVLLDDSAGTTGQAMTHTDESQTYDDPMDSPDMGDITQSKNETFSVAFNSANFLRTLDSADDTQDETVCTSRTTFNSNVWRYNLYHAANGTFNGKAVTEGQRVELDSGFPFSLDGKFGHVGYWGVWYEGGDVANGTAIQKVDFATGTTTPYTVQISPGRLIHRSASTEGLTQYRGYEFSYSGMGPGSVWGTWAVTVDSNNDFVITGSIEWGESGPSVTTVTSTVITPSASGENLWLWSDSLGGNVTYVHDSDVLAANREVTMYSQEFVLANDSVFGASTSIPLYCYERCIKGGLTQAAVSAMTMQDELYHPALSVDWGTMPPTLSSPPYTYTAEISNGMVIVKDHNGNVVDTDDNGTALDLSALGFDWGLNTAEMVVSQTGIDMPWDIYKATESYRWETGSNSWNRQTSVVAGDGTIATFDKPVDLAYTHSTANDANGDATYDGKKFRLNYGGPGELWGFPWAEDADGRWHSSVTLADAVELTDGTSTFVVKGMEKEQTMADQDISLCSALSVSGLSTTLPLPTASDIGTVSFTLSSKPVVTDAPAVIEGELQ